MKYMLAQIILFSLIGGVFSLIGGVLVLAHQKLTERILIHLVTFAAGSMLGAALLNLLPEAIESGQDLGLGIENISIAILVGVVAFFVLERVLLGFHAHPQKDDWPESHIRKTPILLVIGDSIHNLADGVAIATAFLTNPSLGIVTALAVAAHEVPSEIGEFSVMLQAGWPRTKVFWVNLISAFAATVGALLTYLARDSIDRYVPWALAGAVGMFIYIAASDLIPEIHHQTRQDKASHVVTLLVVGIVVVGLIGRFVK